MKAIIYYSHDDIRLENRSIPSISEHELLVQVHGCGLCGSDILKIAQQVPAPVVLGHELTGTIVERGRGVAEFEVGQRVVVAHHVPCGTCHYCRHGNYSMCSAFKASNIDPCGFAEYIRVPAQHVQHTTLRLPGNLSTEEGSFTEPLACCVRAVRRTPLFAGDTVVIMGLGSVGLLMLQAVKALGTRANLDLRVVGVDLLPERLELARALGADEVFFAPDDEHGRCARAEASSAPTNDEAPFAPDDEHGLRTLLAPLTEGRGADAVIITAPGMRPFQQALAAVRKGGTLNLFAAHTGALPLNLETLYQQELTLTSTYSSSPDELRLALELLASQAVRVNDLISHRLPLSRFSEGVVLMRERAALKVYFQIAGE